MPGVRWLGHGMASAAAIGIAGGCGGIGTTVFAAVVAATAPGSLLIDLDRAGGGIDAALGIDTASGARWSSLRLAGGHLDALALRQALPMWGPVAVLAADIEPYPEAAVQVVDAARRVAPVIVDLGRLARPEQRAAASVCDLVCVVAGTDVAALLGARIAHAAVPEDVAHGVIVRAAGQRAAEFAASAIGRPLVGRLPLLRSRSNNPLRPAEISARVRRVAAGLTEASFQ